MSGLGPNPPMLPGKEYAFKGVIDMLQADQLALDGTVLIENVSIQFPIAGGGPITWTASFGVQGSLESSSTGAVDPSSKLAISGKDTTVKIDPGGTPFVVPDVQSVALAFSAPSVTYVDGGVTKRTEGNLSANLTFEVLNRDIYQTGYQPNSRNVVHIEIGDTTYWLLDQIVFGGLTNFNVNVANRAIVGYTVSGQWSAVSQLDVDNLGQLKSPAGVDWFGTDP